MYPIPVGKSPLIFDGVLIALLLIVFFFVKRKLVTPAAGFPPILYWVVMVITGIVLLGVLLLSIHDIYAARTMHCRIEFERVVVRWGLYRKGVRFEEIDEITLTFLTGEYELRLRKLGVSLPGYKIGWFELAGYPKALLFIGNTSEQIVCIKSKGIPILLGVKKPEQFVTHIKEQTKP